MRHYALSTSEEGDQRSGLTGEELADVDVTAAVMHRAANDRRRLRGHNDIADQRVRVERADLTRHAVAVAHADRRRVDDHVGVLRRCVDDLDMARAKGAA